MDLFPTPHSFPLPVVSGPLTLSHMGPGNFREIIDVLPLANTDNGFINTTAVSAFTNFGLETVQMGFAAPIYAWAAEFGGGSDGGEGLGHRVHQPIWHHHCAGDCQQWLLWFCHDS